MRRRSGPRERRVDRLRRRRQSRPAGGATAATRGEFGLLLPVTAPNIRLLLLFTCVSARLKWGKSRGRGCQRNGAVCQDEAKQVQFYVLLLLSEGKVVRFRSTTWAVFCTAVLETIFRLACPHNSLIFCVASFTICDALFQSVGRFLVQVTQTERRLWVTCEAIDAIFDVFGDDRTNPVIRETKMIETLKTFQTAFKSRVNLFVPFCEPVSITGEDLVPVVRVPDAACSFDCRSVPIQH